MNDDVISLKQLTVFSIGGDWGQSPDEKIDGYTKVKVIRGTEFASWSKNKGKTAALRQIKNSSLEKRKLKSGDLVVEVSGGGPKQPVGRAIRIDDEAINNSELPLVCSNFFRLLRVSDEYSSEYTRLSILRDYLNGKVNLYQTSSTNLRNLNFTDFLENIEITKLPKKLQEEKVKLLTVINSSLENSSLNLLRAKDIIKKFRQSILSAAVTGKLTEDWRINNQNINADSLINRLETERKLYQKKEASEIAEPELPEIPNSWKWVSVDSLSRLVVDGVHKTPNYQEAGIPFITVKNLTAGKGISFDDTKFITVEDHNSFTSRAKPEKGDILISKDGTLGVTRAIRTDREFSIFVSVAMIKPLLYEMTDYLELALSSQELQGQMVGVGTGLVHLVLRDLKADGIPLPPLEEQKEIVKRVNKYFDLADKVEYQIANAESKVSKLTQAVLAKTFSNEGVTI